MSNTVIAFPARRPGGFGAHGPGTLRALLVYIEQQAAAAGMPLTSAMIGAALLTLEAEAPERG